MFSKSQDGVITERIAKDEASGDGKVGDSKVGEGKGVAAKLTSDSKRPSVSPSASKPAGAQK